MHWKAAPVEKHSKRGKKIIDLKEHIPQLALYRTGGQLCSWNFACPPRRS